MGLDSPKHQGRLTGKQPKGSIATSTQSKPPKGRNIVVVSQKSMSDGGEEDSEIQTLQVTKFYDQKFLLPNYHSFYSEFHYSFQSSEVLYLRLIPENLILLIGWT